MSVVTKPGTQTDTQTELLEPEVRDREWVRVPGSGGRRTGSERRETETGDGGREGDDRGGGGRGGGDGDDGPPGSPLAAPAVMGTNVLGMLVFIASEAVLFLTLIVTFAIVRSGYPEWPPSDQPRLPVLMSLFNTLVLLGSGAAMYGAWRSIRRGLGLSSRRLLNTAALLGILFLVVQGVEWVRLIDFGLTVTQNIYGAVFYVMIGMHALHVFIAVLGLLYVSRRFGKGAYTREAHDGLTMGGMFWGFVVLVWPLLFVFVYLL
ncbi:MAG: cytochrome c oxidase subunit 3 [Gemmatimonadota bacterium]|nr:cytochrome c oxidase subunit 3 [Gemmatimonadota bacterium]